MKTVITLVGLPGSGKTTLGDMIHKLIGGSRVNADQVRETISCDLKFTQGNREIQAYRMGALAALSLFEPVQIMSDTPMGTLNQTAIVDFVCPTQRTRDVYDWAIRSQLPFPVRRFTIWMDTITPSQCRFEDTAKLFQEPSGADIIVHGYKTKEELTRMAESIAYEIRPDKFGIRKA
jgi:adenylylsulfate kinase-like enzyme